MLSTEMTFMSSSVFIKQTVTLISFQAECHLELAACVGGCGVCQDEFCVRGLEGGGRERLEKAGEPICFLFSVCVICTIKLFLNKDKIRLPSSKTNDLDLYYSRHNQKLKYLFNDVLFMPLVNNPPPPYHHLPK